MFLLIFYFSNMIHSQGHGKLKFMSASQENRHGLANANLNFNLPYFVDQISIYLPPISTKTNGFISFLKRSRTKKDMFSIANRKISKI